MFYQLPLNLKNKKIWNKTRDVAKNLYNQADSLFNDLNALVDDEELEQLIHNCNFYADLLDFVNKFAKTSVVERIEFDEFFHKYKNIDPAVESFFNLFRKVYQIQKKPPIVPLLRQVLNRSPGLSELAKTRLTDSSQIPNDENIKGTFSNHRI